jgi:monoamine oxidase
MTEQDPTETARMTRRFFLERLGAVGGTAAVMAAMRSWNLMAQQVETRPQLSGRGAGKKVIVLGAGVSGMTTGYELRKLGYDVQILEARDRVGGVNWTLRRGATHTELGPNGETQVCNFDEGLYLNGGPWRLPYWHTGVLGYCKELGVPLQLFVNETDASYIYYEGEKIGPLANKRVRLREVKADMVGYTTELLVKALANGQVYVPLSNDDKERLVTFLVSEGYLDRTDHAYKGGEARGAGDPYNFSALLQSGFGSRVRSVMGGTGEAPMFQPIGGMDQFPKGFQRALGDMIHLNMEIVSVHQTPDSVKVVYTDKKAGKQHEATADFVVSCLPLTIVSRLDINLSPEMMAAAKAMPYSPSAKMGLQMKRRFWEEDDRIFGGHLYSNLPFGEFSYPSNDFFSQKGIVLGFYGNGRQAGVVDMPIKGRVEHVLTHASKVHPQIRGEYEASYCTFWEKIEYSRGAFATGGGGRGGGGGVENIRQQLRKPDGRIFIGCAGISTDPGWQQGAVEAGWHAVETLHERAMKA